jgi:hypothetical protein
MTTRMTVTSAGNVGIGTTSPTQLFDIVGVAAAPTSTGTTQTGILRVRGTNNVSLDIGSYTAAPYGSWIKATNTGDLSYLSYPVILQPTGGNVGIGSTSPGMTLDVTGTIRATGEITGTMGTGLGQFRMAYGNYGVIHRNDGGNYYMLLTASGDAYGSWNALRPFTMNLSTGDTTINSMVARGSGNVEFSGSLVASGVGTIIDAGGGWIRTYGATGWYNGTYGGGWNMSDTTWIRAYGGKNVYTPGVIQADAGITTSGTVSMGWERIVNACGGANCTATCTGSKKATGGSCACPGSWVIPHSYIGDNYMNCNCQSGTAEAHIVCANIGP